MYSVPMGCGDISGDLRVFRGYGKPLALIHVETFCKETNAEGAGHASLGQRPM